jgi:glycosyltransferase involved in cell wall biosynthesis
MNPPPLASDPVSVVLPARNEAGNLADLLPVCLRVFAARFPDYELLVVDDGSADDTAELVRQFGRDNPRVRLLRHPQTRGYGAALRSGFAAARHPLIFFTDADGQFDPAEVDRLLPHLAQSEVVAGYRAPRQDPWLRRMYGRLFSALCRWRFDIRLRDVNCAFKLFRRSVLEGIELSCSGALINAELLLAARRRGVIPLEVPVTHFPRRRGKPSGGSAAVIWRAMREFWELDRRWRRR